jgi:hypothetical protein
MNIYEYSEYLDYFFDTLVLSGLIIDQWMICEALCRSQDSIAPKDREFSISKPQVLRYMQSRLGRLVSWLVSYAKNGGLITY